MKVELQRRRGGHDKGSVIDVPDYIGERMLERGDAVREGEEPKAAYPEGEPHESWKVPELKAWAADHDVDLGDATKKDDIGAVIAAHQASRTD